MSGKVIGKAHRCGDEEWHLGAVGEVWECECGVRWVWAVIHKGTDFYGRDRVVGPQPYTGQVVTP